jgi:hypothetical protein
LVIPAGITTSEPRTLRYFDTPMISERAKGFKESTLTFRGFGAVTCEG